MNALLEKYQQRLGVAKDAYARNHSDALDMNKQLTLVKVLDNTQNYLKESLTSANATQRASLGEFKKFCLDITNISLPNLIAPELVITKPIASFTGYIQYIKLVAGNDKGGVKNGDLFNDPFKLGAMNDARVNYTGAAVVENHTVTAGEASAHAVTVAPVWNPFIGIEKVVLDGVAYEIVAAGSEVANVSCSVSNKTITFASADTHFVADKVLAFGYKYDNALIPQESLPTLRAEVAAIALKAAPRRLAIYYSQFAAYQAKTEMGIDLGEMLATQAVAEVQYEIDTEVVKLLDEHAGEAVAATTFNKNCPWGVSKSEHYEAFAEVLGNASRVIYDRTQKYSANFVVIASDIAPMLPLLRGWKPAANAKISGPYFAGTLDGKKVFVSPALAAGRFFVGYNGDDLMTAPAIFAPYMLVVPTQLLGFADGGMSQGFSTLYALEMLNESLLVAGKVVEEDYIVKTHEEA